MRAWQGAQGYCEAAVAQVQHCREALFLILRWGPGSKWSSFLSFVRLMGTWGEPAEPRGTWGGLWWSIPAHLASEHHRHDLQSTISMLKRFFVKKRTAETESQRRKLPVYHNFVKIARTDREH